MLNLQRTWRYVGLPDQSAELEKITSAQPEEQEKL